MPTNPEVRAQRVRDGLCAQCGRRRAARGSQYCREHRAKRNAAANRAQKRRVQERHARGQCAVAGCDLALSCAWYCEAHRIYYNEVRRGRHR